jgi:hypothetical protein
MVNGRSTHSLFKPGSGYKIDQSAFRSDISPAKELGGGTLLIGKQSTATIKYALVYSLNFFKVVKIAKDFTIVPYHTRCGERAELWEAQRTIVQQSHVKIKVAIHVGAVVLPYSYERLLSLLRSINGFRKSAATLVTEAVLVLHERCLLDVKHIVN